jgi:hypothetical protein
VIYWRCFLKITAISGRKGISVKNYCKAPLQLFAGLVAASLPLLAGTITPTPEPASVLLMGGGIAAIVLIARRKRSQK